VSSPGLDRPLFGVEHYERFRGRRAKVRLGVKLEGRRNFEGLLAGVEGDRLRLEVDGAVGSCPWP
jgi:ribosome maturation factor RimP